MGVVEAVVSPVPSWPTLLRPQHTTCPVSSTRHECANPEEILDIADLSVSFADSAESAEAGVETPTRLAAMSVRVMKRRRMNSPSGMNVSSV
jgi:hypothetical protein